VLARELVDVLQAAEPAKHVIDASARPARDEQEHALLVSGIGRGHAAEPKREPDAVWSSRIDGHVEAGTLRVRHIAAGRPVQFRRDTGLRPRGWSECQLDADKHHSKDDLHIKHRTPSPSILFTHLSRPSGPLANDVAVWNGLRTPDACRNGNSSAGVTL